MKLKGWNEIPDGFDLEIVFDCGPKWLEILALTPFFERFAYPIGVNKGFIYLRVSDEFKSDSSRAIPGWEIKVNPKSIQEKFLEGSLAFLSSSGSQFKDSKKGAPRLFLTRWGHVKSIRKRVHKRNGTYSYYKTRTFPPNLA